MSNPIKAAEPCLDATMQYVKKEIMKVNSRRFISCLSHLNALAGLGPSAASYKYTGKQKQICSALCRFSKFILIPKVLLHKSIFSPESKIISLLSYGIEGTGRLERNVEGHTETKGISQNRLVIKSSCI